MGQVHARAYSRLRQHYPHVPLSPNLIAVADTATDDRLAIAVDTYGFRDAHTDWHVLIARDDIDAVSVTGPNFIHRDVAVAAAKAGKHVWVEKPARRNAAETRSICEAVRAAGVQSAAGFNCRSSWWSRGLSWDFRRMCELRICLDKDYQNAFYVTRFVAPGDGEFARFQPGSGIAMGYDDLKVVEAHHFVQSIATGNAHGATMEDALRAATIIEAMAESARNDAGWPSRCEFVLTK